MSISNHINVKKCSEFLQNSLIVSKLFILFIIIIIKVKNLFDKNYLEIILT